MSNNNSHKLITRNGVVIDLILTAIIFCFLSWILRPYVPAQTEVYTNVFAVFTASCLSGLFWLVLQMFRVVYTDMRIRNRD
mgnify:CR=1 FL=1